MKSYFTLSLAIFSLCVTSAHAQGRRGSSGPSRGSPSTPHGNMNSNPNHVTPSNNSNNSYHPTVNNTPRNTPNVGPYHPANIGGGTVNNSGNNNSNNNYHPPVNNNNNSNNNANINPSNNYHPPVNNNGGNSNSGNNENGGHHGNNGPGNNNSVNNNNNGYHGGNNGNNVGNNTYHGGNNGYNGNNNSYHGGNTNYPSVRPTNFAHPGLNSPQLSHQVTYDNHGHVGSVNYSNHNGQTVFHESYNENRTVLTRNFYHGGNAGHDYEYHQNNFHGHEMYVYQPYHMHESHYYNPYWHPFYGFNGPHFYYQWSWMGSPWYAHYGYYYHPYAYYPYPSAWLTDYILYSILEEQYNARMERNAYSPVIYTSNYSTPQYAEPSLTSDVQLDGTDFSFYTATSQNVTCQNVVVTINGSAPENLGGCAIGKPAATVMGNEVYVFIMNSDQSISYSSINNRTWSNLGGEMSRIHSLRSIGTYIEVRAVDSDNAVWKRTLNHRRWKSDTTSPMYLAQNNESQSVVMTPSQPVTTTLATGGIDDTTKNQLQTQVTAELQARASQQTIDLEQKLKDPNHVYPILTDLNVMVLNPTSPNAALSCNLTAGDIVRLAPEGLSTDGATATMQVLTSKQGGCAVTSKVMIAVTDLQESENDVNRRIDEGTEKMTSDPALNQYLNKTAD